MAQGTIKKLVSDRGYGFIHLSGEQEPGKDLFFHRTDVQGTGYDALHEGDHVTYDEATDERRGGRKAANVTSASLS